MYDVKHEALFPWTWWCVHVDPTERRRTTKAALASVRALAHIATETPAPLGTKTDVIRCPLLPRAGMPLVATSHACLANDDTQMPAAAPCSPMLSDGALPSLSLPLLFNHECHDNGPRH